jgi:hypothetical protein
MKRNSIALIGIGVLSFGQSGVAGGETTPRLANVTAAGEPSSPKTSAPAPTTQAPPPSTGASRLKIAGTESPRPQDRLALNYRLFIDYPAPGRTRPEFPSPVRPGRRSCS